MANFLLKYFVYFVGVFILSATYVSASENINPCTYELTQKVDASDSQYMTMTCNEAASNGIDTVSKLYFLSKPKKTELNNCTFNQLDRESGEIIKFYKAGNNNSCQPYEFEDYLSFEHISKELNEDQLFSDILELILSLNSDANKIFSFYDYLFCSDCRSLIKISEKHNLRLTALYMGADNNAIKLAVNANQIRWQLNVQYSNKELVLKSVVKLSNNKGTSIKFD